MTVVGQEPGVVELSGGGIDQRILPVDLAASGAKGNEPAGRQKTTWGTSPNFHGDGR